MRFKIFDSWGGMLSPVDYQEFSWKYINQIIDALAEVTQLLLERMLVCFK
jgi:uroporphyrinogen decarboxylase